MDNKKEDPRNAPNYTRYTHCRNCRRETNSRGPFGEALCGPCWEEEDEAIDALST